MGRGLKIARNRVTAFMDDPLTIFVLQHLFQDTQEISFFSVLVLQGAQSKFSYIQLTDNNLDKDKNPL